MTLLAAGGISIQPSCYSRLTNHWVCRSYLHDRYQDLVHATVQHLQITGVSIALAVAIAFPLALLARRLPWLQGAILGTSTAIYTIPSLALFPLLVPFTGITATDRGDRAGALRPHHPGAQHADGAERRTRRGA